MSFEIKLPLFEGPFDLLLFFIERDELDIYDIPISTLTNDFLNYIHHLEQMNLDVASEFILVASTLMRIKAKLLLPRQEVNEAGQELDPREELVRHLIEYKRYKSIIPELADLEAIRAQRFNRGNIASELAVIAATQQVDMQVHTLDLYKILKVYERVMTQYKQEQNKPRHTVTQYAYTIDGQKTAIMNRLEGLPRIAFDELLLESATKIAAVFNFLAILELLQLQRISLLLGEGFNNFWIVPGDTAIAV
jgi:segregation and condensation protein A